MIIIERSNPQHERMAKELATLRRRHWDLREAIKLAIGCGNRVDLETLIVCIQAALDADEKESVTK
jgi:hypothetical protein